MKKVSLLFAALFSATVSAQTCLTTVIDTAPAANFTDNENGTVTDTTTGLMWMKCAYGQTFDTANNTCLGAATALTWQQALQAAHGYQFANLNGWRLPNVKELATITEKSCVRPSIDETIFPSTPSDDFWTSTPSASVQDSAWVVAFFNSSNAKKPKDNFVFSRLVRNP